MFIWFWTTQPLHRIRSSKTTKPFFFFSFIKPLRPKTKKNRKQPHISHSSDNQEPWILVSHVLTLNSQDLISNSPYCLPYSSCDVCLEKLVLDQLTIPYWYFSLFSSFVYLMLYWYCKEKFCLVLKNNFL